MLALEDGRTFRGRAFGATAERVGEVVFNTSMTGYQEVLTDPSYCGQIVVMTCPEIGNVGTNALDAESTRGWVEGFAVRRLSAVPSNWRASQTLAHYLREQGIPGIEEIDTRALTRHLRSAGALRGVLSAVDRDVESLVRKARQATPLEGQDLVSRVTCAAPYSWDAPRAAAWAEGPVERPAPRRCVAVDYGVKQNSLRLLYEVGFDVTVVPATASADTILGLAPDAIFLSNGPGDPAVLDAAVATIRQLIGRLPILGICLGHQLAARALGAGTFKLKFGHHGVNHPVRDLRTGRVAVTSQNHGYAVDASTLPPTAQVTHVSLNDATCEGFAVPDSCLMTLQFHPESSPGPHDALAIFREFRAMAERARVGAGQVTEGEP